MHGLFSGKGFWREGYPLEGPGINSFSAPGRPVRKRAGKGPKKTGIGPKRGRFRPVSVQPG